MLLDLYTDLADPVTAIDSAADGLLALLQARSGLSGVSIVLGWPRGGLAVEGVMIEGDVGDWRIADLSIGRGERRLEEDVGLAVRCYVQHSSNDYAAIRSRVEALAGEVIQAVRADPTLANAVEFADATGGRLTEIVVDEGQGRGLQMVVNVAYRVELYG